MASPLPSQSQTQPQPLTPPAEPSQNSAPTNPASNSQPTATNNATSASANPAVPLTSLQDNGLSKRPRDARLIHLILASMGVSAYQERVPLQLLDFAYRYTSGILTDALHIQAEGYDAADAAGGAKGRGRGAGGAAAGSSKEADSVADPGGISLTSLRMAIGGRSQYQFQQGLPKEFLLELASKRNAVGLPGSVRAGTKITDKNEGVSVGGVRLPHEKYCLTGTGWALREQWDSEGEEEIDEPVPGINGHGDGGDAGMGGMGQTADGEDADMEDAAEREGLEDLFGGSGGNNADQDQEMGDG